MDNHVVYTINGTPYTVGELKNAENYTVSVALESSTDSTTDDSTTEVYLTFDTDGAYAVSTSVSDMAGNTANSDRTYNFVVDQTRPDVAVSYFEYQDDGSEVDVTDKVLAGEKYFAHQVYALIRVTDANFADNDASENVVGGTALTITAADSQNQPIASPDIVVGDWEDKGNNVHIRKVELNSNANYTLTLNYTDKTKTKKGRKEIGRWNY